MNYSHITLCPLTNENISCASCKVPTLAQLNALSRANLAGLNEDSGGNTRKNRLYFVLSDKAGLALE